MEETIRECENPGVEGEEKDCATSLESMIDFSTSKLGKNVQAISTEVESQTQCKTVCTKHLAFQVLNVKPGTVPVCHFLPQDHVVWLPN
ncbi:hypothetical protein DKX38_027891 [Salix brachista]|uniref:BURP domain-containing protein n=1 Tax=Salix brachista TaxID=2182728 RepID=A0A5N5J8X6_9ROSI|nr:hypothetical protein DKX38_027891 [Salix brachista]